MGYPKDRYSVALTEVHPAELSSNGSYAGAKICFVTGGYELKT